MTSCVRRGWEGLASFEARARTLGASACASARKTGRAVPRVQKVNGARERARVYARKRRRRGGAHVRGCGVACERTEIAGHGAVSIAHFSGTTRPLRRSGGRRTARKTEPCGLRARPESFAVENVRSWAICRCWDEQQQQRPGSVDVTPPECRQARECRARSWGDWPPYVTRCSLLCVGRRECCLKRLADAEENPPLRRPLLGARAGWAMAGLWPLSRADQTGVVVRAAGLA